MKWLSIFMFLFATNVYAAEVVCFDPASSPVADQANFYRKSANTPLYSGDPNCLINPDMSAVAGVSMKYWKRSGSSVLEMTAGEKTSLNNSDAIALDEELRTQAKSEFDGQTIKGLTKRCSGKVLVDEHNAQSSKINAIMACFDNGTTAAIKACVEGLSDLPARSLAQFKAAVGNCVDFGEADE